MITSNTRMGSSYMYIGHCNYFSSFVAMQKLYIIAKQLRSDWHWHTAIICVFHFACIFLSLIPSAFLTLMRIQNEIASDCTLHLSNHYLRAFCDVVLRVPHILRTSGLFLVQRCVYCDGKWCAITPQNNCTQRVEVFYWVRRRVINA